MPLDIEYTWLARAALESLPSSERDQVVASIDRLRDGLEAAGTRHVERMPGDDNLYVMRVGRGLRLRVVFTVQAQKVFILDVISRNLVRAYVNSVAS